MVSDIFQSFSQKISQLNIKRYIKCSVYLFFSLFENKKFDLKDNNNNNSSNFYWKIKVRYIKKKTMKVIINVFHIITK